jgi:hypothetical protein
MDLVCETLCPFKISGGLQVHKVRNFRITLHLNILAEHEKTQRSGNWVCFRPETSGGRHKLHSVRLKQLTSISEDGNKFSFLNLLLSNVS